MKKIFLMVLSMFLLCGAATAGAAVLTFTTDQMAYWGEVSPGELANVTNYGPGLGVDFEVDFSAANDYSASGWNDINVGWSWDSSGGWNADYSGYDGYGLTLTNFSTTPVMANLFMNTGLSPTPDARYESDWVWLEPYDLGDPTTYGRDLFLDFSLLEVQNLHEVSAIGIGMGLNGPSSTEDNKGTGGTLGANPVPVPGAVWLLGGGLIGLVGLRRRRGLAG